MGLVLDLLICPKTDFRLFKVWLREGTDYFVLPF
jgi:hypothetical protein